MRVLFLVGMALMSAAGAAAQQSAQKIAVVRAMPYYPATGEIARDKDLFDPKLALFNLVIEHRPPSGIKGGTTATYVEIEVPFSLSAVELEAMAVETGRILLKQSVNLAVLNTAQPGNLRVPFLVHGTGCEKLKLTARLLDGATLLDEQSRTVPFVCRE
jgi:hypothetical protein